MHEHLWGAAIPIANFRRSFRAVYGLTNTADLSLFCFIQTGVQKVIANNSAEFLKEW